MKRRSKQDAMVDTEATGSRQAQNILSQVRYDEHTKHSVVLAMLTASREHPLSQAGQQAAAKVLGYAVNIGTLHQWLQQYGDEMRQQLPALPDIRDVAVDAVNSVVKDYLKLRRDLMDHLADPATIAKMTGQQTAVSIGIMEDKIERLTAISPENAQLMGRFIAKCQQYGVDHKATLDEIMQRMDTFYRPKLGAIIDVQPRQIVGDDNDQ